tara:strand:- start:13095 stop:13451 length:357 start_codon:yes stop_codon:yes gene_type:complete
MIYLASVYSLDAKTDSEEHKALREKRYLQVMRKTKELLEQGLTVLSPIVHCHPMSVIYGLPKDFSFWEKLDKSYIDNCDVVWVYMMKGWERSEGITAEIAYAKSIGKPVIHIEEDDID